MPSPIAVTDLITSAMRLIGVVATGETITANEASDALLVLNDLLENWSTERLSVWGALNQSFPTVPGQATYTIGAGGNFNTVRPVAITDAYMTYAGTDTPVEIISQKQYNDIEVKNQSQQYAEQLLYVNNMPLGSITLWPVPSTVGPIVLSIARTLTFPVAITDTLTGPPGFLKALRYCLAVELAPEYGTEASATVVEVASDAKSDFKRSNITIVASKFDAALLGCGGY